MHASLPTDGPLGLPCTLSGPRIELAFYLQLITFAIEWIVYVIWQSNKAERPFTQVFSLSSEAVLLLGAALKIHTYLGWHIWKHARTTWQFWLKLCPNLHNAYFTRSCVIQCSWCSPGICLWAYLTCWFIYEVSVCVCVCPCVRACVCVRAWVHACVCKAWSNLVEIDLAVGHLSCLKSWNSLSSCLFSSFYSSSFSSFSSCLTDNVNWLQAVFAGCAPQHHWDISEAPKSL